MNSLPALFISHGAPDLPIRDGAVTHFLRSLHQQFPKPKAILVISAHWNSATPTVSKATKPQTIYDFGGFPDAVYQLNYPAPGAPVLADSPEGEASPTSHHSTNPSWNTLSDTSHQGTRSWSLDTTDFSISRCGYSRHLSIRRNPFDWYLLYRESPKMPPIKIGANVAKSACAD